MVTRDSSQKFYQSWYQQMLSKVQVNQSRYPKVVSEGGMHDGIQRRYEEIV
jgi:hypothetical protein